MELIKKLKDKILSILELIFYFICIILILFTFGVIMLAAIIVALIVYFAPIWIAIVIVTLIVYFT